MRDEAVPASLKDLLPLSRTQPMKETEQHTKQRHELVQQKTRPKKTKTTYALCYLETLACLFEQARLSSKTV